MEYNFRDIEAKWQQRWKEEETFKVTEDKSKEKFYALDMFPYPSGAGLHVGHPLGYIATDIYSRYKKLQGFNVLHPMGYDSFGLPAEQYAIQTGQHPAITTENNIKRYRNQLDRIGFAFDWSREVRTSDPSYYRWTQWIFKQLFEAWYNKKSDKAEPISTLVDHFNKKGNHEVSAVADEVASFSADEWKARSEVDKQKTLLSYRLAYLADTWVNWCAELGTVLANDEVKDGVSERGGHPVERKLMRQWSMRITAYAERMLNGLDVVDWPDALKEQQRNWIGRSEGAMVRFDIQGFENDKLEVFTTRPDTIFGVTFMVLAPENPLVEKITTDNQRAAINKYVKAASLKSERDRMADVKNVSGEFTGAYVLHPFTGNPIPIWIGDYVLAGYGTGAVMAVPCGDQRDWDFAKKFDIPIVPVYEGMDIEEGADPTKDAKAINSDFLNGLVGHKAISVAVKAIEDKGIGEGKINYRLRDAVFSRQRYWGEPFPVFYRGEIPYLVNSENTVELPPVDKYLPTNDGEPPLARAKKEDWNVFEGDRMETNTMPGWAGSSWYFLRYMDAHNDRTFADPDKIAYWNQVDLYIGGAEHATGHLLYSRFWTKFLFDMGYVPFEEPFKKLINQGMILGRSSLVYRDMQNKNTYVSKDRLEEYHQQFPDAGVSNMMDRFQQLHVDVNIVNDDYLDKEAFRKWQPEYKEAVFYPEEGKYLCGDEVEKMSKRWHNVIDPEILCDKFGADTLRMYEMFLGPLEQHKPWDTKGITGVHNFLRKFWRLYHNANNQFEVSDAKETPEELKVLHKIIAKTKDDLERYSFNTVVSGLMIAVNELTTLKCNKKAILSELVILLSPYAPHISEEIWSKLGNTNSVSAASFPVFNPDFLKESVFEYPVSFNGKMRFKIALPADMAKEEVQRTILENPQSEKWLSGKTPKKVIVVPKKIVNIVL